MIETDDVFGLGTAGDIRSLGDTARQAVDALRGYAYQVLATTLAWLDVDKNSRLFLEVAEDYAIVAGQALQAVQVKDTGGSRSVTLNSGAVRAAIASFVDLSLRNPGSQIHFRFLTTSEVGVERVVADRPARMSGIEYWRRAAQTAKLSVSPIRRMLEGENFPESVREFCKARSDESLRHDIIQRISWDCGRPDFATLRGELDARLVIVGLDRFNLPAPEARRVADHLMWRVLEKCTLQSASERVLTHDALSSTIDELTRISVPRRAIDALVLAGAGAALAHGARSYGETGAFDNRLSVEVAGRLVEGVTLPEVGGTIQRVGVESAVAGALRDFGAAILVGGSGLGKSIVARAVAGASRGDFVMADFRFTKADEACHRLEMIFSRLGGMGSAALILDDFDCIDDPRVTASLARVIDSARRHNCEMLITCHHSPSWTRLSQSGLKRGCAVDCPYFTEEECSVLVATNGGDPDIWGRLAFVAGSGGHPQLTHAFVIGMGTRGWPMEDTENIFHNCILSDDVDGARDGARRYLVSSLPEGARNLLYRLSLTTGSFSRSLALAIGDVPAPVPQIGECLDQLVGPWIETVGEDRFRVSPLAGDFGRHMLSPSEQQKVHETFAVQMADNRTIDASDADTMMMHAIAGRVPQVLVAISQSVLTGDSHTLEMLAEHLYLFRFARVDQLMYPEDTKTSWILKLAQFKLAAAAGDGKRVSDIVTAIFREVERLPSGERDSLEVMAVLVVLSTVGVANYVDDWPSLLHRLRSMVEAGGFLQTITSSFQHDSGLSFFGVTFSIGIANLASVRRLECVINELDKLDESERGLWLTPIDESYSDYYDIISGPWAQQQRRDQERFDAAGSAIRYERMAATTLNWLTRSVSLQCSVAQSVMLDEYQNDKVGALRVLRQARSKVGDDPILGRALANVHFRHCDHRAALSAYRGMAVQIAICNRVERAFTLRKAAISAAKCGEWSQAQQWFGEAAAAAASIEGHDMAPMAIGLRADSAVADFEAGNTGNALTRFVDAVQALSDLDPADTLRAAYCHRVVRHSVVWMLSRAGEGDGTIYGTAISLEAGSCSNPDPPPTIREHPLGHIDIVWYMLTKAEVMLGIDVGISEKLEHRLGQGTIPMWEIDLRTELIRRAVGDLDVGRLIVHFKTYVEGQLFLPDLYTQGVERFNPLNPQRGEIPVADGDALSQPAGEHAARDAILAFGICSAISGRAEAMTELASALDGHFPVGYPGRTVLDHWKGEQTTLSEFEKATVAIIKALLRSEHIVPNLYWTSGVCFLAWTRDSRFKDMVTARLGAWQRREWQRIVAAESFRLARPQQTVPPIEEVLTVSTDDRRFVANLLLAASDAVDTSLAPMYREMLKPMANEE